MEQCFVVADASEFHPGWIDSFDAIRGYFKCCIFSFEKEGEPVQQVPFDLIFLFRTGSFYSDVCVWIVSVPNDA